MDRVGRIRQSHRQPGRWRQCDSLPPHGDRRRCRPGPIHPGRFDTQLVTPADHDRFDQPGTERSRCPGPQGLSRDYERDLFRYSGRVFARWTMRSWPTGHRGARSTESLGPARLPESVWSSRGPRISGRPHMHFPYSGRLGIIDQTVRIRTQSTGAYRQGLPRPSTIYAQVRAASGYASPAKARMPAQLGQI